MRLIDFKKGHRIEFEAPEGEPKPYIDVRLGDMEYAERIEIVKAELLEREGLAANADLPDKFAFELDNRASVGPFLINWGNFEDDYGKPIASRTEDGSLHFDNGYHLLCVSEIRDAMILRVNELRHQKTEALEAARGNLQQPLPVN